MALFFLRLWQPEIAKALSLLARKKASLCEAVHTQVAIHSLPHVNRFAIFYGFFILRCHVLWHIVLPSNSHNGTWETSTMTSHNYLHEIEEAEFHGDTGAIVGTAHYDVTIEGRRDVINCELAYVSIDGAKIPRSIIEAMWTSEILIRHEDAMGLDIADLWATGDMDEVA